jgi:flavin-dependent dehydrogenase
MNREENTPRTIEYDAVIVGAGPTGSLVAEKLAAQGLSVVILEAGSRFRGHNALENTEANAGKIMWTATTHRRGADSNRVVGAARRGFTDWTCSRR